MGDPVVAIYEAVGVVGSLGSAPATSPAPLAIPYDRRYYFDDFDRSSPPDAPSRGSVRIVDRDGPAGVLLHLGDDHHWNHSRHEPMLRSLAQSADLIDAVCWGVLALHPEDLAHVPTPSHADLLALECGVDPSDPDAQLPALVLLTSDLSRTLLCCKGEQMLSKLAATGAAELRERLRSLVSAGQVATGVGEGGAHKGKADQSLWRLETKRRANAAAAAAEWVRDRGVRLLFIEPEGILKKQCNVSLKSTAFEAISARRRSLWGASRHDAFYPQCVPFLRALLLRLPETGDPYDPLSQYGEGPKTNSFELRQDAPHICLVTNLGHLVSKTRPGEHHETRQTVPGVRSVLDTLMKRLASELGLSSKELEAKVSLKVSFRAPGAPLPVSLAAQAPSGQLGVKTMDTASAPSPTLDGYTMPTMRLPASPPELVPGAIAARSTSQEKTATAVTAATTTSHAATTTHATTDAATATDGDEGSAAAAGRVCNDEGSAEEWSEEWAKPRPGMVNAALKEHGLRPEIDASACLYVGYDFVDQDTASAAGVDYIDQQFLLGVERFDVGFEHDDAADAKVNMKRVVAPRAFASERNGTKPVPRSPNSRAAGKKMRAA